MPFWTRRFNSTHFIMIKLFFVIRAQAEMMTFNKILFTLSLYCLERVDAIPLFIHVSASPWIQAFCPHESAPFPSDPRCCLVLHTVQCLRAAARIRWNSLIYNGARGRAVRQECSAPLSRGSSASDARLSEPTILTWAFHPLSDHTTGDRMASRLWRPTSTSLHQSKYHMRSTTKKKKKEKSHASPLEPQCQRTCGSASRKGKSFKRAEAVIKCAALQENWNWETN